jgi:hypothetical protein
MLAVAVTSSAEAPRRSFAAAQAAVAELDSEALRLKRPVNRALAAELMRGRSP